MLPLFKISLIWLLVGVDGRNLYCWITKYHYCDPCRPNEHAVTKHSTINNHRPYISLMASMGQPLDPKQILGTVALDVTGSLLEM